MLTNVANLYRQRWGRKMQRHYFQKWIFANIHTEFETNWTPNWFGFSNYFKMLTLNFHQFEEFDEQQAWFFFEQKRRHMDRELKQTNSVWRKALHQICRIEDYCQFCGKMTCWNQQPISKSFTDICRCWISHSVKIDLPRFVNITCKICRCKLKNMKSKDL